MTIFVVLDQHGAVIPLPGPVSTSEPMDYYKLMNYLGTHGHEQQLYGKQATTLIVGGAVRSTDFHRQIDAYIKDKAQVQATVDEMIRVRHRPEWVK